MLTASVSVSFVLVINIAIHPEKKLIVLFHDWVVNDGNRET